MTDKESVTDDKVNTPISEQEKPAVETLDPVAATESRKREPERTKADDTESSSASEDEWIGPMPTEAVPAKKRKGTTSYIIIRHNLQILARLFISTVLEYEKLYLDNLPDTECYEKSYMHRDIITHVVATKTDFVITASIDGHVKFWKKMEEGIEFVKHFRSHLSI